VQLATFLAALGIAVGLGGIIVPALPGLLLIVVSVGLWAVAASDPIAWWVLGLTLIAAGAGWALQFLVPGRRLRDAGVPTTTMVVGAVFGVIGVFVVPVVGLALGFVVGILLAELIRLRTLRAAWPSALHALKAALLSSGIELAAGMVIATIFAVGAWRLLS